MKSRLFIATVLALVIGLFTVIPVAFAAGPTTTGRHLIVQHG